MRRGCERFSDGDERFGRTDSPSSGAANGSSGLVNDFSVPSNGQAGGDDNFSVGMKGAAGKKMIHQR